MDSSTRKSSTSTTATTSSSGSTSLSTSNHSLGKKLLHSRPKSPAPTDIPGHNHHNHHFNLHLRHHKKHIPRSTSPTVLQPSSTTSNAPRDIPSTNPDQQAPSPPYLSRTLSPSPLPSSPTGSHIPDTTTNKDKKPKPRRRHSDEYRRYAGTVNHCGRHANEWLFGGFSVRDTVRDGVERVWMRRGESQGHSESELGWEGGDDEV